MSTPYVNTVGCHAIVVVTQMTATDVRSVAMTRWVISDLHFWHDNIIKFCDRPYEDSEEMNEALVDNWNTYVKPQDHIYNLGDVSLIRGNLENQKRFIKINRRLRGHKTLFLGNHDHFDARVYISAGYKTIHATWRDEQSQIIFSHFPLHPSSLGQVRANVHGHIHDQNSPTPAVWTKKSGEMHIAPYINVSVEKTNYHPISFEEVEERIAMAREKLIIDASYPRVEVENVEPKA